MLIVVFVLHVLVHAVILCPIMSHTQVFLSNYLSLPPLHLLSVTSTMSPFPLVIVCCHFLPSVLSQCSFSVISQPHFSSHLSLFSGLPLQPFSPNSFFSLHTLFLTLTHFYQQSDQCLFISGCQLW